MGMTVAALDRVVDALRGHRLLKPEHAAEFEHSLRARFVDPRKLVEHMTALGWLTRYQADRLLGGSAHDLILGPYALLDRLGEGSAARVFRARHRDRGDIVAVK